MIEDEESIQYVLIEVINALMRNTIDVKRASLIIRALHIAVKNTARVKFGIQEPVTKVPEYAAPPQEHEAIAQQSELPAVSAIPYKPVDSGDRHFWEYQEEGGRILAREAQARKAARTVWRRALSPVQRRPSPASVRAHTCHPYEGRRRISPGRSARNRNPTARLQNHAVRTGTKRVP